MLSRPYLETALWLLVLLLMLAALFWVMDPWDARNRYGVDHAQHEPHAQHDEHDHHLDDNKPTMSVEGMISWRATAPLKQFTLTAVTAQGKMIIIETDSLDLINEEWLELRLPANTNTYLLEAQWQNPQNNDANHSNQALEIVFALGQKQEKSWFFWGDETPSIQQVLEY